MDFHPMWAAVALVVATALALPTFVWTCILILKIKSLSNRVENLERGRRPQITPSYPQTHPQESPESVRNQT